MDHALVEQLVHGIEGKDMSTAAHTWRVVLYTRVMAEAAGMDAAAMRELTHAAALHDVGKLDIPREILTKPARLTPEEFEVIKQHPVTGYARMIKLNVEDPLILDLIRFHHERWDGTGYPYGYAQSQIPLSAQHFAVIDSFDAMTSVRPYRHEVGQEAARHAIIELKDGAGSHYAPEAVKLFCQMYDEGRFDWILNEFNDACEVPTYAEVEQVHKSFARR